MKRGWKAALTGIGAAGAAVGAVGIIGLFGQGSPQPAPQPSPAPQPQLCSIPGVSGLRWQWSLRGAVPAWAMPPYGASGVLSWSPAPYAACGLALERYRVDLRTSTGATYPIASVSPGQTSVVVPTARPGDLLWVYPIYRGPSGEQQGPGAWLQVPPVSPMPA